MVRRRRFYEKLRLTTGEADNGGDGQLGKLNTGETDRGVPGERLTYNLAICGTWGLGFLGADTTLVSTGTDNCAKLCHHAEIGDCLLKTLHVCMVFPERFYA